MKKTNKICTAVLAVILALSLAACSQNTENTTRDPGQKEEASTNQAATDVTIPSSWIDTEDSTEASEEQTQTSIENTLETGNEEVSGDFSITTEDGAFTQNGNTYTITAAGTYVLSGTIEDGQILVEASEEDTIELDLNGVLITCAYDSPIYVKTADKVKIKAIEGTQNSVFDKRAPKTDENDTTGSAAIYAECDLNLVGTGTLTVISSYNNAIHTKDDLTVKNLTLNAGGPNNALKGNDTVTIESGTISLISTGGDGIKTENSDVSDKGNQRGTVTITGGNITIDAATDGIDAAYDIMISDDASITITAGDDGIHAENKLQIDGGYVEVADSHEGLEGYEIVINDGEIHVYASDDGVNATGSSSNRSDGLITVNGGKLYVEVTGRDVDGIDSNGSYKQTGGFVVVSNPYADSSGNMSAVDVDGTVDVTGGTIIALGTVPGQGGQDGSKGQRPGNPGGGFGFFGMGGMNGGSVLPDGAVTFTDTFSSGTHTFSCGDVNESFTLKTAVSGGWIWTAGVSEGNYTLK